MSDDQQPVEPKAAEPKKAKAEKKFKLPPMKAAMIEGVNSALEKSKIRAATVDEVSYLTAVSKWVSTGIYALDLLLSKGKGLPCGRFVEVFGNEGSGKTALCEYLVGRYVHVLNSAPHYLDFEDSYDQAHLDCYNVKGTDVIMPHGVGTIEDGWNYIGATLDTLAQRATLAEKHGVAGDPPTLFVWDSIANSAAKAELEEDGMEDKHMAEAARAFSKAFRKYTRRVSNSDSTVVFVNQVRDVPGATGRMPKTTTPGGRAIKFACCTRLRLAKVETLKKGERVTGQLVEVQSVKNKHAPAPMRAKIVLSYTKGVDVDRSNFLWFKLNGYIVAAGGAGYRWKPLGKESEPFKQSGWRDFAAANRASVLEARDTIYAKELAAIADDPSGDGDDDAGAGSDDD